MGDDDSQWYKLNFTKKQIDKLKEIYYNSFNTQKTIVMLILFTSLISGLINNYSILTIISFILFGFCWIYMCILENVISVLDVKQILYLYGKATYIQNKNIFIDKIKCKALTNIKIDDVCLVIKYKNKYYAMLLDKFKES